MTMPSLLLIAALAWGQELPWPKCTIGTLEYHQAGGDIYLCFKDRWIKVEPLEYPVPDHARVREWLRPDLYLTPGSYSLGTETRRWGQEGFANIYLDAPFTALIVRLPDGRSMVITRAEIERRGRK